MLSLSLEHGRKMSNDKKPRKPKQLKRDKDHTAFYKWIKYLADKINELEKRIEKIEKKLGLK